MQFHLLLFSKILVNGFEFVTPTLTQRAADQNEQCCGKLQNEEILTIFFHPFDLWCHWRWWFYLPFIGVFRYKKTTPERTSLKELGPCQSHKCHESFLREQKMTIELRFFHSMMELTNLASYTERGKWDLVLYSALLCIWIPTFVTYVTKAFCGSKRWP